MIDWNKLQPYKTTKTKSFEQLCYQLAVRMSGSQGKFTPIDDSGGGDGVEFYLTFPDETEWGWQAKYYEGSPRLNVSGRKAAIISSLERATRIHPKLKVWYLCVPMDLTPDENSWVEIELLKHIPTGHPAKIIVWNESFFHEKLNRPEFNGLNHAFFNKLELTADWFQRSFDKFFSLVKNKFDSMLYTPNKAFEYDYVNPLLCNDEFIDPRMVYYPQILTELFQDGKKKLDQLNYTNNFWSPLFNRYIERYSEFNQFAERLMPVLWSRLENIRPNTFEKIEGEAFAEEIALFRSIVADLDDFRRNWYQSNVSETKEEKKQSSREQLSKISEVDKVYREFTEELNYYVSHSELPLKWRSAHFLGNGGDGKTNFAVALVKGYLDDGLPAIYIPAITLTGSTTLADQMLTLLDIKSGYTFGDLLDCLDVLGKINNKRIPVVLDGLNEAVNGHGFLNERLSLDLPQMETEFLHRKNLVLVTTCRTSYQQAIWDADKFRDSRFHFISGFTNHEDKRKLVRNYFRHYKIQADLSFISLERFTKPLYLKLFCESVNSERKVVKQVTLGFDSIYSIFDDFVSLCDVNVFKRIKKAGKMPPSSTAKQLATKVLSKIGEELWLQHKRAFLLDDLMIMADGKIVDDYQNSITKALLDEELLFVRNWANGDEHVYLTYDLLAGYFIAKHLLEVIPDFRAFFDSDQSRILIDDHYEKLHPNHEDILDGICSLLPIKKQVFVHDLIGSPGQQMTPAQSGLFGKSIAATVLLSPEYISAEQVKFIEKLASNLKNFKKILSLSEDVLFVSGHPFNFKFWSSKLSEMAMNERDIFWSEFLRTNLSEGFLDDQIIEFEDLQLSTYLTEEQFEKIRLVADYLKWTLSSTDRAFKEKSGNALFTYGVRFPKLFLEQFYSSATINDPSIFEWMSGALYTTVIFLVKDDLSRHKDNLNDLAVFLRDQVLHQNGGCATNHLGIRNYAINILKLLVRKIPEIAALIDLTSLLKNMENVGIIDWLEAEDLNEDEYRDGNSLIDYYFNKEKMPHICRGFGSEYDQTPEYLGIQAKLRWRAYQLGYEFVRFGEIDKQIANRKDWGGNFSETERYADKYIDIAFQEYLGYLDASDSFENHEDIGYESTFKLKYDPKHIEELQDEFLPPERFVQRNFIDTKVPLKKWCNDRSVPDLSEYLERDSFQDKIGEWVLLNGLVHQHDKPSERQFYFKVDTVFVRNADLLKAREAFTEKIELGRASNSIPYTENVHESEIPDGESIPNNVWKQWRYSLEDHIVEHEYTKMVLIRNGSRLEDEESDMLWDSIFKQHHLIYLPRTCVSEYHHHIMKFRAENANGEESLEKVFQQLGVELVEEKFKKQEQGAVDEQIGVFIPVRCHKEKIYLCKNLIDDLGLVSPFCCSDLMDSAGKLASFNFTYEVEYVDQETFTYLRRDLLAQYLFDNQLTMFQIIWGERDYYPIDGDWMKKRPSSKKREWASLYRAVEFNPKG